MWWVLKRRVSALRVFVDKVLFILWSSISKVLGEAMRIYKADCDTKIIKTVWDYTKAILGL